MAAALGWYDKHDPDALLQVAVEGWRTAADGATEPGLKQYQRACAKRAIVNEFARKRAAGVPIPRAYQPAALEAALEGEVDAHTSAMAEASSREAQLAPERATADVDVLLSGVCSTVACRIATGDAAPRTRAPLPCVFVVDREAYASPEWRRLQSFSGTAAGGLQGSVVQYVMEVGTAGAFPALAALDHEFPNSTDRWYINGEGDPVRSP